MRQNSSTLFPFLAAVVERLARVFVARQKTVETPPDALPNGTVIGDGFEIVGFLGSGGFGFTYLAEDGQGKRWALKECYPTEFCRRRGALVGLTSRAALEEFTKILGQFEVEAECIQKFDHPNIVGGGQLIEQNNTAYIVLEFVVGRTLSDYLEDKRKPLNQNQLLHVMDEVSEAVRYVHDVGYLHKDISPDNVMIDETGKAVLIDFGSSAPLTKSKADEASESDLLVIKDGYSPQEFYNNSSPVSKASDVYQLGATLYHCISGQRPPASIQRLYAKACGKPDPMDGLVGRFPQFPADLLETVDKALAVFVQDRLQTVDAWTKK